MIFTELQQAVAALHNADAFFTETPGCPILWDGQKEDETKKLHATAQALEDTLNTIGVVGIVSEVEVSPDETVFAIARFSVLYIENVALNRGPKGTGRTAHQYAQKAMALLIDRPVSPWSPLVFEGLVPAKVNREGFTSWELQFRTSTMLSLVCEVLADELGAALTGAAGETLANSPTNP